MEDPRAELMRRLLEYEQMKTRRAEAERVAAGRRDFELVQVLIERTVEQRLPHVSVEDLRQAWLVLLARAKLNTHHNGAARRIVSTGANDAYSSPIKSRPV